MTTAEFDQVREVVTVANLELQIIFKSTLNLQALTTKYFGPTALIEKLGYHGGSKQGMLTMYLASVDRTKRRIVFIMIWTIFFDDPRRQWVDTAISVFEMMQVPSPAGLRGRSRSEKHFTRIRKCLTVANSIRMALQPGHLFLIANE